MWQKDSLGCRSTINFVKAGLRAIFWTLSVNRHSIVNWSSPSGELDHVVKEDAGKAWCIQTYSEGVLASSGRGPVSKVFGSHFQHVLHPLLSSSHFKSDSGCWRWREPSSWRRSCMGARIVCRTLEGAGRHWQAKWSAVLAIAQTKTRVWEKLGKVMEQDFWLALKLFW